MNSSEWFNQVKNEIGGCDELITHIIQKVNVIQTSTTLSTLPRSKGILLYGKPGTGKTVTAITIASKVYILYGKITRLFDINILLLVEYSKLPYYVLNSPDIFQTGMLHKKKKKR
jgi:DNA replication protein DnaC